MSNKKPCSVCGTALSTARATICRACYREQTFKPAVCTSCGGATSTSRATMCRPCINAKRASEALVKNCVDCGAVLTERRSSRCLTCHTARVKGVARKCVDCGVQLLSKRTERCRDCWVTSRVAIAKKPGATSCIDCGIALKQGAERCRPCWRTSLGSTRPSCDRCGKALSSYAATRCRVCIKEVALAEWPRCAGGCGRRVSSRNSTLCRECWKQAQHARSAARPKNTKYAPRFLKRMIEALPCGSCGYDGFRSQVDKIEPIKGYVIGNVSPACGRCHDLITNNRIPHAPAPSDEVLAAVAERLGIPTGTRGSGHGTTQ